MKQLKINAICKKFGPAAVTVALATLASPVFAAEGDIDTSKPLLYIAGGLAAAGAVTGAMFGLVALIGAAKKAQRAGT
ncbi:hypothetical protein BVH03_09470 [Pseudomonas sp. PA15(2017)]|uniref:hypothetical protein n=1 Tax=Pseudomonas sp. PA15(2017) TaxID=1932111 RepID=UPI00095F65BE|nr:hypothetical protein [Pseudomonas sp. PA15(2017)]OLU30709.1 hypothetical protein BVH03_09470 [Pseudomonas sp. PA15(2017)]